MKNCLRNVDDATFITLFGDPWSSVGGGGGVPPLHFHTWYR